MGKRLKEVDRVIADLDAKIESLQAARALIVGAKVATAHAKPKAERKPRAVAAPKGDAA